jgi:hypothetical protein
VFAGALGVAEVVEGLQRHLGIAIDLAAGQHREKRAAPQRFRPVCEGMCCSTPVEKGSEA